MVPRNGPRPGAPVAASCTAIPWRSGPSRKDALTDLPSALNSGMPPDPCCSHSTVRVSTSTRRMLRSPSTTVTIRVP